MTSNADSCRLKARWVFPVSSPPIADGVVEVCGGRIEQVTTSFSDGGAIDLGNTAILPGLVNCHTHLEFSDLPQPLGRAGIAFPDWIERLLEHRRDRPADVQQEQRPAAIQQGIEQSVAEGVTLLGEIATAPDSAHYLGATRCVVFHEVLGLSNERAEASLASAASWLEGHQSGQTGCRKAISPHAPYTVSWDLLEKSIALANDRRVNLAMHLAESADELELLAAHSGPLVDLLDRLEFWSPSAVPRGLRPLDYLQALSEAERVMVVHGNYLASDELSLLAEQADHMSLVFCPRTHAYFGHGPYPLDETLRRGVNLALGTDSRASNPDLSIWNEMRFLRDQHPQLSGATVLRLGTLAGAVALGLEQECGTLEPGRFADLCLVDLPDRTADPYQLLFAGVNPRIAR